MDDDELREALKGYVFYHVIPLTPTISTDGWTSPTVVNTQELALRAMDRVDLAGARVLDVGCRDGLFSFAAERAGAAEVVGIDNDLSEGAVELLIPYLESNVRMHEVNVYDLTPDRFGRFDVVVCPGVLYHLRDPFTGLKRIRDVLVDGGWLILETALWIDDSDKALLHCPIGAESPFEATSCTFFNEKGLADTLQSLGFAVERVEYLREQPKARPWPDFKRRVKAFLGRPTSTVVDRSVWTCRAVATDPAPSEELVSSYWFGTHDIHSVRRGDLADSYPVVASGPQPQR
jgi:SAM-dependent methyltransferase